MILVRYATLAALVIWLAAMLGERFGDLLRRPHLVALACGGAMIAGLFVLKFIGPPPMAFVVRTALVVLMLAVAFGVPLVAPHAAAELLLTINIGLGLVLLIWYVRE